MMFSGKKSSADGDFDLEQKILQAPVQDTRPLIEEMCRRDNFFHSCWMQLKYRRPDIWEEMTRVELFVAGMEHKTNDAKDVDETERGTVL